MARWEPNARERLEQAAMELFAERGYDATAVVDIAARAGLTERTFFRHFADKREVLFGGSHLLAELLANRIADAPASVPPMEAIALALEAISPFFEERRAVARKRYALIAAHAELRERELIKLASLGSTFTVALRRRGVADSAAGLVAETGIAIFKIAFERWVHDSRRRDLASHVRRSLDELRAVTAASNGARSVARPKKRPASK
jgi:AcrR family transcriptional regulator